MTTPKTAWMFPGQGSQFVGMRQSVLQMDAAVAPLFDEADEILGFSLSRMMDEGDKTTLTQTENAQPAILTTSIAAANILEKRGDSPDVVMGHSLGEYSALVACGSLAFADALRLVRKRGELMAEATERTGGGSMAAVKVADMAKLEALILEINARHTLELTNLNSPKQVVLSGANDAIEEAVGRIKETKAGRAMKLNVSAPFHCSLMRPIAETFETTLENVTISPPRTAFIDNVTGGFELKPEAIRAKLVKQLYSPVLWLKALQSAQAFEVTRFVEVGAGKVLCGLARQSLEAVEILSFEQAFS